MSREIKFRTFFNGMMSKPFKFGEAVCFSDGSASVGRNFELMQFTGLHDVNGVEIYEGDIISDHIGTGVVKYAESFGAFRVSYGDGYAKWFYDYLKSEFRYVRIIGNIHQNPELLEQN